MVPLLLFCLLWPGAHPLPSDMQSLPPTPPDLPLGLAQTLQITPDRVLRAIVLRAVDDEPRGAGGFDLRGWEEGAKVRSVGLTG